MIKFFRSKKHNHSPQALQETNKLIAEELAKAAKEPLEELYKKLKTSDKGLTEKEAKSRLRKEGPNTVEHEKEPSWYMMLLKNFIDPFNVLLITLSLISYFLKDIDATIIIFSMVTISVIMRFFQEYRSTRAAEKLKKMVSIKTTVIRRSSPDAPPEQKEIIYQHLVIGDIVHLTTGDIIPADLRLLSSKDLIIEQAALTGESMPVNKSEHLQDDQETLTDFSNLCFLGTHIVNGSATGIILKTGRNTYFGSMAKSLTGYRPETSFDKGINQVSWLLIKFMAVMVPLVFIINLVTKGNFLESFFFALSVAVGLTPAMLPMIVTVNLAKGAIKMSRKKVIVKQLSAIQNFGAMDILCTDKTGTLTENKIILEKHLNLEGKDDEQVLQYAYLNSYYQTGLKNLMDVAILKHQNLEKELDLAHAYQKVDEISFDFERRRMSVVVEESNHHLVICKGAVEEVLSICSQACVNGQSIPMTDEIIKKIRDARDKLNLDGLRVLALAYKETPNTKTEYQKEDESEMTLIGFLAFLDPPKASAKKAIATLQKDGIEIKIITGDNPTLTQSICKMVGLNTGKPLIGAEIDKMNDQQLQEAVMKTTVFAKINPLQKSRLISAFKACGHTVGYLGDGINDAAALREADIGISVDSAVDIAKESASIILLEHSLHILGEGVIEGRKTFGNTIKYIKMAASSNFGNVFSILGASILLPFLPMKPLQLLIQNLLYDISQTAIPFDHVDRDYLSKPRKWEANSIGRFMIFIGPISSIFDYLTFAVLWFIIQANTIQEQALFQSGWFVEGLLSQTLIVHMIRTQKIPFIQSWPSWPLLFTTVVIMAIGVYIPYSYVGRSIGMTAIPFSYFPWLLLILLSYCILTQVVKFWYIKRFHNWL